jgi:hypothetical protein
MAADWRLRRGRASIMQEWFYKTQRYGGIHGMAFKHTNVTKNCIKKQGTDQLLGSTLYNPKKPNENFFMKTL